jgi:hypothetical protein
MRQNWSTGATCARGEETQVSKRYATVHFTQAWSNTCGPEVDEAWLWAVELGENMNSGKFHLDRMIGFGSGVHIWPSALESEVVQNTALRYRTCCDRSAAATR